MNALTRPQAPSMGYRFLAGLAGGAIILGVTRLALLALPIDGSVVIRMVMDFGGIALACIAPIQAISRNDMTHDGAMAAQSAAP